MLDIFMLYAIAAGLSDVILIKCLYHHILCLSMCSIVYYSRFVLKYSFLSFSLLVFLIAFLTHLISHDVSL
jgi:hypothetical protein